MRRHWHFRALVALAVALLCMFIRWLSRDQGWRTFEVFGSEFGLARIKALTFVVWRGELFRFPFDWILSLAALVATVIAMAITLHHFRSARLMSNKSAVAGGS